MSRTLSNGYTVVRVEGVHNVGGEPVRSFRDDADKVIVVTDNGDADELVSRTAEAVDDSFVVVEAARRAAEQSRESSIEILHALTFQKAPVIPQSEDPRLPYGRPSGA